MELSIQERLKTLRVECGLTLEQLAEQPHLSKSALGSYEGGTISRTSATMPLLSGKVLRSDCRLSGDPFP